MTNEQYYWYIYRKRLSNLHAQVTAFRTFASQYVGGDALENITNAHLIAILNNDESSINTMMAANPEIKDTLLALKKVAITFINNGGLK